MTLAHWQKLEFYNSGDDALSFLHLLVRFRANAWIRSGSSHVIVEGANGRWRVHGYCGTFVEDFDSLEWAKLLIDEGCFERNCSC